MAVLGCGYVGLELCRQLAAHDVVGVRRSRSALDRIESTGARAVRADVTATDSLDAVHDVDPVVFAASSGGRGAEAARSVYVDGLETAVDHFCDRSDPPDRVVYTSSTGVYGDHGGDWVDESAPVDPTTEKTAVLAEAERVAVERPTSDCGGTVVRFAGLYGPDRYRLQRSVRGPVTEGYLTMVHRDDAAGAIRYLLEAEAGKGDVERGDVGRSDVGRGDIGRGDVVNVVDDEPVSKWAFADWLADRCGVGPPPKRSIEERLADGDLTEPARRRLLTSKRIANDRVRDMGYPLTFPTFRQGYRRAISQYRGQ